MGNKLNWTEILLFITVLVLVQVTCTYIPRPNSCGGVCDCQGSAIWCDDRNLTAVPYFPLITQEIYLQKNNITSIRDDTFIGLLNVNLLNMSRNTIVDIESRAFLTLAFLQELDLSYNLIGQLPARMDFPGSIMSLQLSHNQLTVIEDFTFQYLEKLKHLNLKRNKLSSIKRHALAGLKVLDTLNLADNALTELPENLFSYLSCVREISLAGNRFQKIPNFSHLYNLQVLNMSRNALTSVYLENNFAEAQKLEVLDFSHNQVADIPGYVFRSVFSSVKHLNLSFSGVKSIDESTFFLEKLESLDLSGNEHVSNLPKSLMVLEKTEIKSLRLSRMKINDVSVFHSVLHMTQMEELEQLELSHNQIHSLPEDIFQRTINLQVLDISFNHLRGTQGMHLGLSNLRTLYLNGNKFSAIPFIAHEHCDEYDPPTVTPSIIPTPERIWCRLLESLTHLDLSRNSIRSLPKEQVRRMMTHPNLQTIDMSHNEFSCTCDILPLCDWIFSNSVRFLKLNDTNSYLCHQPKDTKGRSLLDFCRHLTLSECKGRSVDSTQHTKLVAFSCVAVAVLLAIVVGAILFAQNYRRTFSPRIRKSSNKQTTTYSEVDQSSRELTSTPVADQSTQETFVNFDDSASSSSDQTESDLEESDASC